MFAISPPMDPTRIRLPPLFILGSVMPASHSTLLRLLAKILSKAAGHHLVRNLAAEWGPKGLRVNAIAPGLIKTEFARALWEDPKRAEERVSNTPLRRLGEPRDIGGIAVFLASPAAAFITGQCIVADGGVTIL